MDILAVSCDSFEPETNELIGRRTSKGKSQDGNQHLASLERVRGWCRDYRVAFKINSVVNRHNVDEDMNRHIKQLNPVRWKVHFPFHTC